MTYSAVALGNFDGVHKAHAKLIKKTVASAKNNNLKSIVYTFEEHPSKILFGKSVKQIMTNGQKSEIIKKLGADEVFFEKTVPEVLGLSAEDFFVNILCKRFNAKFVAAGFNYTFGKGAGGNAEVLRRLGEKYGTEVYIMPEEKFGGGSISSSAVRAALLKGDIKTANALLGHEYTVRGAVEHGKALGGKIGFKTANVTPEPFILLPSSGVYKTKTYVCGKAFKSITNVGTNPTVENAECRTETNIFDFDKDIYGETIDVVFLEKIRDKIKFKNTTELSAQIRQDKKIWKESDII